MHIICVVQSFRSLKSPNAETGDRLEHKDKFILLNVCGGINKILKIRGQEQQKHNGSHASYGISKGLLGTFASSLYLGAVWIGGKSQEFWRKQFRRKGNERCRLEQRKLPYRSRGKETACTQNAGTRKSTPTQGNGGNAALALCTKRRKRKNPHRTKGNLRRSLCCS